MRRLHLVVLVGTLLAVVTAATPTTHSRALLADATALASAAAEKVPADVKVAVETPDFKPPDEAEKEKTEEEKKKEEEEKKKKEEEEKKKQEELDKESGDNKENGKCPTKLSPSACFKYEVDPGSSVAIYAALQCYAPSLDRFWMPAGYNWNTCETVAEGGKQGEEIKVPNYRSEPWIVKLACKNGVARLTVWFQSGDDLGSYGPASAAGCPKADKEGSSGQCSYTFTFRCGGGDDSSGGGGGDDTSGGGGGGMQGDPHVTGFDGRDFDFDGTSGRVFNIMSEPRFQVNALFSNLGNELITNNYMTLMGFRLGGVRIAVEAAGEGRLAVFLADQDVTRHLPFGKAQRVRGSETTLILSQKASGQTLQLRTPLMAFTVVARQAWLDVQTSILDASVTDMHGVIGQTWRKGAAYSLPVVGGQAQWDGSVEDYVVADGLFGSDSHFCLFREGEQTAVPAQQGRKPVVRRMALERLLVGVAVEEVAALAVSTTHYDY